MWKLIEPSPISSRWGIYIKNAFRRFESVYRPEMLEMHLQNFEKIHSQKSGEISRNLRFSRFFVPASKSDTHHGRDGWDRTNEMQESKSCALPLGYIPMQPRHYTTYQQLCQEQLWQ